MEVKVRKASRRIRIPITACIVAVCCVTLLVGLLSINTGSATSKAIQLTGSGQLRYSLEELLHKEFGQQVPSVLVSPTVSEIDFNCGNCGPLAREEPFGYIFGTTGTDSPFKLRAIDDVHSLFFGNYGEVIEIRGRPVQCGSARGREEYLVAYGDSPDLVLYCQAPESYIGGSS
jgi:hypothetical protein